jgi:hypothetical protein
MLVAVVAAVAVALAPASSKAQDRRGPTPPRLAFIDGDVSFWRPGAADWTPAQMNTALAEGDEIYVAGGGNAELQLGTRAFVRAGSDTQIGLEGLDDDSMQFEVTGGHAAFDIARLPSGTSIEIDTPRAAFTIERPGYYRVDVDEQRTAFGARRGGIARVVAQSGDQIEVRTDQGLVLGDDRPGFDVQPIAAQDDWDRWNFERTSGYGATPRSATYVPPDVAGVDDLDRYGDWQEEPRYGRVWRPRGVAADWSPYSTGRWVYDPYYEWTWVDDAPWGWAPYHYGRWVNTSGYWGWAPGPIVAAPVYAPALVAFFGAPGIGVSVSVGAPFVSWCPLGFGEPVIPWWGGAAFVGRPYWGGWGGPRIVNNVVINNTRFVNADHITHFSNFGVRNAVVGLDHDRFRRGGRPGRVGDNGNFRPLHGDLGVRPAAQSFMPHEGRGRRPPAQLEHRPIVTTRPRRDPIEHLRARGVETAAAPGPRREARVVHPRGGGDRRFADHERPGGVGAAQANRDQRMPDRRMEHGRMGRGEGENGPAMGRMRAPEPPRAQREHGGAPVRPGWASRSDGPRTHERVATPSTPPNARARREERGNWVRPDAPRARLRNDDRGGQQSPRAAAPFEREQGRVNRDQRRAERETPRADTPGFQRRTREPQEPRHQMDAPREVPRGDRTRWERPRQERAERSARQDRDFAPTRREPQRTERAQRPQFDRSARRERNVAPMQRQAPRTEREPRPAPAQPHGRPQHERRHGD